MTNDTSQRDRDALPEGHDLLPPLVRGGIAVCLALLSGILPFLFTAKTMEAGAIRVLVSQTGVVSLTIILVTYYTTCKRCSLVGGGITLAWGLTVLVSGLTCLSIQTTWHDGLPEVWRVLTLMLLACLASQAFRDECERRRMLGAVGMTALGISLYAFSQKLGYDPVKWSASSQGRVFGTIGNPNMLAAYCVALMPIFISCSNGLKSRIGRVVSVLTGAMLFVVLLLTECRGAILGVAVMLITSISIYRKALSTSKRRMVVSGVMLVLVSIAVCIPLAKRVDDWRALGEERVGSSNVRVVIWRGVWRMFKDNPVLGVGPGQFTVRFPEYRDPHYEKYGVTHNTLHAHCEPLELLAEFGIIGFGVYAGMIGLILWVGFRSLPGQEGFNYHFLVGLLCGVIGLLGHNLVSVNLRWPVGAYFFWLFLGLIAGYAPIQTVALGKWKGRGAVAAALVLCGGLALCVKRQTWEWYRSEVLTMTGKKANARGRWKQAREALLHAVSCNPTNVRARYYLAYAHFQQRRFSEAIEAYHGIQKYSPDYCQVHYSLAACFLNLGRWEDAAREYALQQRIGGLPDKFHFESLLNILRSNKSSDEKYRRSLEHLVAINPTGIIARNLLGNYHFNKGDFNAAREHYVAILKEDETNIPALNNLAGVHFSEQNFAEARNICLRILEITPREVVPTINLGKAYYMLGMKAEARKEWLRAKELAPNRTDIDGFLKMVGPQRP